MHSDTQEPEVYKFKGQCYVMCPCFQQSIHKNNMEGRKVGLVESYLKTVFDELLEMQQEDAGSGHWSRKHPNNGQVLCDGPRTRMLIILYCMLLTCLAQLLVYWLYQTVFYCHTKVSEKINLIGNGKLI